MLLWWLLVVVVAALAAAAQEQAARPASQCLQRVTLVVLSTFTGAVLLHSP
jgi:hypothetical protein